MRIRADSLLVSSVLFTIALLCLIPAALWNAFAGHDKVVLSRLDDGFRAEAQTASYLGVACLAIILIGLVVTWTGYIKHNRSAWLVMFILVWLWAFPLLAFPFVSALIHGKIALTFSESLYEAISQPGSPRSVVESILIVSLMVIALLLPIKRFFVDRDVEKPIYRPSSKLIGLSLTGILVMMIAMFTWIRIGVLYEIPLAELNSTQRLPSPPPPLPYAGN